MMKSFSVSPFQQQVILGITLFFILFSFMQERNNSGIPASQNFLNDIFEDLGFDKTVTNATAYLLLFITAILIVLFFFEKK